MQVGTEKEKKETSREPHLKIPYRIIQLLDIGTDEKLLLAHFYTFAQRGCAQTDQTLAGIFMTHSYKIAQYIRNLQKFIDVKIPPDYRRIIWVKAHYLAPQVEKLFCPPACKLIPLTLGKFAVVDDDDYERLCGYRWLAHRSSRTFYASRKYRNSTIHMHRRIMNAPKGMVCDHINHNGLDNRKSNLRICTARQNSYNQRPHTDCVSRYKGVHWLPEQKKWKSRVRKDGKTYDLGLFDSEITAAVAYDLKADELFGEFACLNFPKVLDGPLTPQTGRFA